MVKVISKMVPFAQRQAQVLRQKEKADTIVLSAMAEAAVDASPVDTATYITSHVVYEGDSLASIPALYSSDGREGGQARGAYEGVAKAKLTAQIGQMDFSQGSFLLGNEAEHRGDVEYLFGYAVFDAARGAFPAAVEQARAALRAGQGGV